MRFAIIATPRSGNSVLRKTIAAAYELQEFGGHDAELLRADLPDDSIVQVHARYSEELHQVLVDHGVIIVTPTRHPLDTLLSMLHFKQFEPATTWRISGVATPPARHSGHSRPGRERTNCFRCLLAGGRTRR
jgi:hypothetical protein